MISRSEVVAEARSWLDTPFHHQARLKGIGVDCVGLVIGVARELGLSQFDTSDYSEQPDPERMGSLLREHLDEIAFDDLLPADIVWLKPLTRSDPQHVAMITEVEPRLMMIHAYRRTPKRSHFNRVVEHGLDERWRQRVVGCFRLRGVE